MKLIANLDLCQGYANCLVAAPDLFDLSDDGKVVVLDATPSDIDRARIQVAVGSCPVRALSIED